MGSDWVTYLCGLVHDDVVKVSHFELALKSVRPTVGADDLRQHEQFTQEFGSG